jgi:hypothetical protein
METAKPGTQTGRLEVRSELDLKADFVRLVREVVRDMVPAVILEMDGTPPGGDLTRALLGYDLGTLVWRYEQGGGQEEWEWDTTVDGNVVTAAGGKVKFSTGTLPSADPDPLTVDFAAVSVDETRFLFVETVVPNGTVALKIQADRPVDDPASSTYRKALSIWKMRANGPVKIKTLFHGEIDYSALNTP